MLLMKVLERTKQRRVGATGRAWGTGLVLGALGIVFGDIGTSPLYAVQTVFSIDGGVVAPTAGDVFGVVSLVFWSITLIVSVKYVVFVLRADNDGEGGVMALAAYLRRILGDTKGRRVAVAMGFGVLGAALFFGDSVITPAISVLSAVEGLEVVSPALSALVLPIALTVLTVLFAVQRWGTEWVGRMFGPVMALWFLAIGAAGVRGVWADPGILRGLSPTYAADFVLDRPGTAFVAMGAVVLAITGAEALYADLGHFGPRPIRRAWFYLVFPALTLNYLAQGALILADPSSRANPFFLLLPDGAQLPMVLLATAATVIASQAVISGAFSVARQALRLGLLPRLRIRQTSGHEYGQIYVARVNWLLFAAVLAVVLCFRSADRLATAYGVAVTGTFVITTALFLVVARARWRWSRWRCLLVGGVFGGLELTFFAANLTKIAHGGWLTLVIAAAVFTVMVTWQQGYQILQKRREELEGPLRAFIQELAGSDLPRVPGLAVFLHASDMTTPLAWRLNVAYNHVRHEHIVIISSRTAQVPHVPWSGRLHVDQLGDPDDGILYVAAEFGFQDRTDIPAVLRHVAGTRPEADFDPGSASYFVSHVVVRRTDGRELTWWRKRLFLALTHNAADQSEFFHLPIDRTIVLSTEVGI
jgi:KUP system potassium uptake protein